MSKKVYYTEAEAAAALHVSLADLGNMVRDKKIKFYPDGARKMFKVDEVEALVAKGGTGEIELAPAEEGISLSDADSSRAPTKEDTVITAEGISIFDDEDLEIESADPMAKTQIAPSIEDQTSIEGVGSGSGLLDLTRESDDTSLGAEVLDHIDIDNEVGSGLTGEISEPAPYTPPQEMVMVEAAASEAMDANSGLFSGMVIAASLVMMLLGMVAVAAMQDALPGFVEGMSQSLGAVIGGCLVVIAIGAVAGFLMGKAVSARQAAMRNVGA